MPTANLIISLFIQYVIPCRLSGLVAACAIIFLSSQSKAQPTFDEHIILAKETIAILTPGTGGTGVIVGKKGDTYTALTAAHVLKGTGLGDELQVESLTSGKKYNIIKSYTPKPGVDIALVQFTSQENFNIAPIAAFYPTAKDHYFRNSITEEWNTTRYYGIVYGASAPTKSVKMRLPRLQKFDLRTRARGNEMGLELIYTSQSTVPGMSGGGVYGARVCPAVIVKRDPQTKRTWEDDSGLYAGLVAIHGRSEEYANSGGRSGVSLGVPMILIRSYLISNAGRMGIPVGKSYTDMVLKACVNESFDE